MTDNEIRESLLNELVEVIRSNPELRVGQVISGMQSTMNLNDLFNLSDAYFLERVRLFCKILKRGENDE